MRFKNLVLVVLALLAINLPAAHSAIRNHQLASSGVEVSARVVQQRTVGGDRFLAFAVPAGSPRPGDPAFRGTAQVDARTDVAARGSGTVQVRVLPGSTTTWRVAGQAVDHAGLVVTGIADLLLLVRVVVYLRFRHRLRAELVLLADEGLTPGAGEAAALERIAGERYVVSGVVARVLEDAVVLDVAGRRVRVLLAGHASPARTGEPVSAVGTMIA